MPNKLSLVPTLGLLVTLSAPALATTVVIPDDYPTIQAAIDGGADVIQVRDGLAPERLTATRFLTIEPAGYGNAFLPNWTTVPVIRSLELKESHEGIEVHGMRFLGQVNTGRSASFRNITFENCRLDSSFTDPGLPGLSSAKISIQGCLIFGSVDLTGYAQFVRNTVIGGGVRIWADGRHDVRDNYIQGPADVGLDVSVDLSYGVVDRNTIRGTSTGILCRGGWVYMAQNDIADCTGDGIHFAATLYPVVCTGNSVARCGGSGISADYIGPTRFDCDSNHVAVCGGAGVVVRSAAPWGGPYLKLRGNIVENTVAGGIDLGPKAGSVALSGNVVLDAGGDGITTSGGAIEHNVVGRSKGTGIRLIGGVDHVSFRFFGNTVFSSGGVGIQDMRGTYASDSLFNNISVLNGGPGLSVELTGAPHTGPPQLGCNDWFQNTGDAVVGMAPGSTDLQLNPLFCDLPSGDVHLASNSPLLSAAGCGLVGALGEGCAATTAVNSTSPPEPTTFRASPVPAKGEVAFEIPPSAGATTVEVFDVTGARRWQGGIPAGVSRISWDRQESTGRRAAPGVYFARLRRGELEFATVRLVLAE